MNKLKVAVIGTGMIANSAHFPALNILRKQGLIDVVGVADIREEAAAGNSQKAQCAELVDRPAEAA